MLKKVINRLRTAYANFASKLYLWTSPGVTYGNNCICKKSVELYTRDGGRLHIHDDVQIQRYSLITARQGLVIIGNRSTIGYHCIIASQESIAIGEDVQIAEHVTIRDQDHVFGKGKITRESGFITAPITIEDNVWIGSKVSILKGVTIGQNSVIAANAVVTQDIPPNCVAGGIPAKVIRQIT